MFFKRKQHRRNVSIKEVLIERSKTKLDKSMDKDIKKLDELNKILSNGIVLELGKATHR